MFAIDRDKYYPNHIDRKDETTEVLPPGMYSFNVEGGMFFHRPVFKKEKFREGLLDLEGTPFNGIKKRLTAFFNDRTREIYRDTETRHFIGCMLYGPPGTGKTCFIDLMCKHFADTRNAVTLRLTDAEHLEKLSNVLGMMRNQSEDRMIIILLEELDKI